MPRQPATSRPLVFQLKVTLRGSKPPIWRRLQVTSDTSLDDLHEILQVVMGWDNYHLYQFVIEEINYSRPDFELETDDAEAVTLSQVVSEENQRFAYEYDFGDFWEHDVLVEKILPLEPGQQYPLCLAGKRACPPEDCGGVWGYADLLDILQDPNHPEYEEMMVWLSGKFDLDAINQMLWNRV